ncbi:hypothetical protein [Flavobacterium litorale]|uniref:HNH endonuclease n=1 Tax=Flavobacterium litorale TaxID=2856519 RepID=A0ABX8V2Y7_9FLAO|nr:hypothetical protein [Flavobacterium litorale]QYJ67137.1 hypothetical protein K1I41_06060 [Flavobacterium litorale]
MNCYNCGIELSYETNHVEHIPAKNLFNTYPEEYKQNLLTVPACYTCNVELFSKIDQEIRDVIGVLNNSEELKKELTAKAAKSIMRKSNWKDRLFLCENGKSIQVSFSYNDIKSLHIKNFKGLFYGKYGKPLSEKYKIVVIAEGDEEDEKAQEINKSMRRFLNLKTEWDFIGHPKVFRYKMIACDNDKMLYDIKNIDDAVGFVCIMNYHNAIHPLVMAFINK